MKLKNRKKYILIDDANKSYIFEDFKFYKISIILIIMEKSYDIH
jgi:hypothetical protein